MKEFVFFLKRDLRLLLPVNVIAAIIFFVMMVAASVIRMRFGQPFDAVDMTLVFVLLVYYFFLASILIIAESVWREWRKGTQIQWYLAPGSVHVKLFSKMVSTYMWLNVQFLFVAIVLLTFIQFAATEGMIVEFFEDIESIVKYPLQAFWMAFIVQFLSLVSVLFPAFIFFGVKTWTKYLVLIPYGLMAILLYPYLTFKFSENVDESVPLITTTFESVTSAQIVWDLGLLILLYSLIVLFLKKKIEL
ncbi:hypothetical protein ABC345_06930 [Shouchella sp. 1P09AA]|uniref:hypothetical protein n=1 Tax=unclassified Shouchella TaxID=2893065 RepID=UPI0039A031DE